MLQKYSLAVVKLTGEVKNGLESHDPILGQIQTYSVAHDGNTRQVSEPELLETQMKEHRVEVFIEKDSILKTDTNSFRDFLWKLQDLLSSEMKKNLFEVLSKTTEAAGQVYNAENQNIWDANLRMVESMPMYFDEEGKHNYQFVVHPDTYKKLAENPPTQEQEKAMEELIKAKREEYYAQKRIRRLS